LVSIIAKTVHRTHPHAAKYPIVFDFVSRPKEEEEEKKKSMGMRCTIIFYPIQYKTVEWSGVECRTVVRCVAM
jgi:hypothetical protein